MRSDDVELLVESRSCSVVDALLVYVCCRASKFGESDDNIAPKVV